MIDDEGIATTTMMMITMAMAREDVDVRFLGGEAPSSSCLLFVFRCKESARTAA
jgi:hypothetical protein